MSGTPPFSSTDRRLRPALIATGLLVVASGVVSVAVVHGATSQTEIAARPAPLVEVAVVAVDDGERALRATGMTRSTDRAPLSFTVGGRVLESLVAVGDTVEAGQPLARLEASGSVNATRSARARARASRAQLGLAYRNRRRSRALSRGESLARSQLDDANATVHVLHANQAAAAAQVDEARRVLAESVLVAPFAGIISEVDLSVGEFVVPGRPVMVLSGNAGLEVEVEVPEAFVHRVEVGGEVRIDLPLARREELSGVVTSVGRAGGSRIGRLFPVIVEFADVEGVAAGMAAEVTLYVRSEPALTVPLAAVFNPGGQHPHVYVVRDGLAERVGVDLGDLVEDAVTVRGGDLLRGEPVVVRGHLRLVDGEEVRIRPGAGGSSTTAPGLSGTASNASAKGPVALGKEPS